VRRQKNYVKKITAWILNKKKQEISFNTYLLLSLNNYLSSN
jgi:hypothetical protein